MILINLMVNLVQQIALNVIKCFIMHFSILPLYTHSYILTTQILLRLVNSFHLLNLPMVSLSVSTDRD